MNSSAAAATASGRVPLNARRTVVHRGGIAHDRQGFLKGFQVLRSDEDG